MARKHVLVEFFLCSSYNVSEFPFQLMKKFTVFTIILTLVVLVVFSEVIVNEYLPGVFGGGVSKDGGAGSGADGRSGGNSGDVADGNYKSGAAAGSKSRLPAGLDAKKSLSTSVLGSDLGNYLGADDVEVVDGLSDGSLAVGLNSDSGVLSDGGLEVSRSAGATYNDGRVGGAVADGETGANPLFLDPNAFADGQFGNELPNAAAVEGTVYSADSAADGAVDSQDIAAENAPGVRDFEDESFVSPVNTVYLRNEQIKSAGFADAYLEDEAFDGRLFKTILIDDLKDAAVTKTLIRNQNALLAKVYIFKTAMNANVSEVYELLKLRAGQGLRVSLNETNEFGLASFYMNDPTRADTAFLTVRIAGFIYSFSYPKAYHSQIKNMIKLIEWELG